MIFDLIPSTLRMTTPLGFAALGGIYSERSGVINIALEGMMLIGAYGYVVGAHASGSAWIGLSVGIGFGIVLALLHAVATKCIPDTVLGNAEMCSPFHLCVVRKISDMLLQGIVVEPMGTSGPWLFTTQRNFSS